MGYANVAVEDKERVASALSEDLLLTPLAWGYKNTAKQQTSVSAVQPNISYPLFISPSHTEVECVAYNEVRVTEVIINRVGTK